MKKTSLKHLFRTVKKNAVSFLAVAFIAAISIAIYIGLQSAATATLKAADRYFDNNRLASFEAYGKLGITAEDIKSFEKVKGVSSVEGGYSTSVSLRENGQIVFVNAISLCDNINLPVILKGRLPNKENEVAVEEKFANKNGISVGDSISLTDKGLLKNDSFKVSAIINRPEYCCAKVTDVRGSNNIGIGALSYYMCFSPSAFNSDALGGRFTKAYIRADALDEYYCYSDKYDNEQEKLLEDLKASVGDTKQYTFATRNDMGDLRAMEILVDSIYGLSYVMSIIFILVAVIVCYAAVSRMIYEQRSLIGAQKALGFSFGEVLRHYMLYNILCALLGLVLGVIIGIFIVELIVIYIFTGEFLLPEVPIIFPTLHIGISAAVCVFIFIITSYAASIKLLRQPATVLLKHEVKSRKKPFFFEGFGFYKKSKLYTRSMIKNVLNDKERMVTTIMGVVGCIALIIICFSLKRGIENSSVKQFNDYFLYENRLVIDSSTAESEEYENELKKSGISYIAVSDKLRSFYIKKDVTESCHIVCTNDFEKLQDFMVAEDAFTGKGVNAAVDGVYISRKCAEVYDLSQGSTIMLANSQGEYNKAKVLGVIEHYLPYNLILTTNAYYEDLTGEEADQCVYLLKGDIDGLYDRVAELDGFISLKDNSESAAKADQVNMVIGLCIALAAAMSVLVLLNQIVMNISRKSRELAVMRINGYTIKETKMYVCKDNIVLTAIGLLLGCVFGAVLSYLSVCIMEGEINRYVRSIDPVACIIGVVIGAVFAVIVNIIALRKIEMLDLTGIQKD